MIRYEPRPVLKITPSASATDKRVQSYSFIEAVEKLPSCFTSSEIDDLLKRISPKLHGRLQSLFVVVSDDMVKKRHQAKSSTKAGGKSGERSDVPAGGGSKSPGASKSPVASGSRSRQEKRGASSSPAGSEPVAKK